MFVLYRLKRDIGREPVIDMDILKIGTEEECYEIAKQDMQHYEEWGISLAQLKRTGSGRIS